MAHEFREGLKASLWPFFARPLDPMSLKDLEGLDGMGGGALSLAAMRATAGAPAGKGKGISFAENEKKLDAKPSAAAASPAASSTDGGRGNQGKAGAGGDKGSGIKVLQDDTPKARAWPTAGTPLARGWTALGLCASLSSYRAVLDRVNPS